MTIKTTCGIATLKDRELSFKQTIASIYPQVDRIFAVLNLYDEIPKWIKALPKVIAIIGKNNLGDASKFLFIDVCKEYHLSCDDDLIYPSDYAYKMRQAVDKYKCVCTLHGKRYNKQTKNFRKDYLILMQCLANTPCDTRLHLGGTGVMAFHTRDFHPSIADFPTPNMSDLWISKAAAGAGVPIMGISHHKGWLKYMPPENPIWDQELDMEFQTGIINSFLKK
jgi:hypothetical protein